MKAPRYINLPIGMANRQIDESDLRAVQSHMLLGDASEDDEKVVDAVLSFVCVEMFQRRRFPLRWRRSQGSVFAG